MRSWVAPKVELFTIWAPPYRSYSFCLFMIAPQPNPLPSLVSKHVAARAVRMDVHMSKQRLLQFIAVHDMYL